MRRSILHVAAAMVAGAVAPAALAGADKAGPACAHDPHYEDRALWPAEVDKTAYRKQAWAKARLLVWAHPGKGGPGAPDPASARNWLEGGRPATSVPDANTDVLLPDSAAPYSLGHRGAMTPSLTCRHLTVGDNATVYAVRLAFHGNVWIRPRGGLRLKTLAPVGDKHTFLRSEVDLGKGREGRPGKMFSVYFKQNKPGGSVEMIGHFATVDEVHLFAGATILSPGCRFEPGRNSTPLVDKGASLVLLDGAYFGKWLNDMRMLDLVLRGTLQGGTPSRPLAKDATLALSFRNWNRTELGQGSEFTGDNKPHRVRRAVLGRRASLMVEPGGAIRTFAADGSEAKLVVRWHGIERNWVANLDLAAQEKRYGRTIPRYITVYLDANTTVDGVRFDHVHKGGVLFRDAATRATWRNITFGAHNGATPDELFRHLPDGVTKKGSPGRY